MNRDLKKEALEKYVKQLSVGDYSSGNLIMPDKALGTQALQARDIAEQALANEFLKNTGLPVPDRFTSVGKAEDFLNRSLKEAYPELEPNLKLLSEKEDPFLKGNLGTYSPKKSGIILNRAKFSPSDIKDLLATTFHEGAHQYDDKILKYRLPKELAQEKSQLDFKKAYDTAKELDRPIDPTEMYEIAAKGHHARIPKLRDADSFGLGALKSYLKSGTFKAIPVVGPAIGAGVAAMSGEANAASAMPILGEADSLGPEKGSEDYSIENPQASPELRRKALESLLRK